MWIKDIFISTITICKFYLNFCLSLLYNRSSYTTEVLYNICFFYDEDYTFEKFTYNFEGLLSEEP